MERDTERVQRVVDALRDGGHDALVCALPANVLLLTGYWPVIGSAIAVATSEGRISLLAPADERDMAETGWADDLRSFEPGGLEALLGVREAAAAPLGKLLRAAGLDADGARIAFEGGGAIAPSSYVSMHVYGCAMRDLIAQAAPRARLAVASDLIARSRAVKTPREVESVARACSVAERAFRGGATHVLANLSERSVAAAFAAGLESEARGEERSGGFAFCMSGPNAAEAGRAYARSRARRLEQGEVALVHCNSHVGGWWTDITRTYCTGAPGAPAAEMYEAVLAARAAALAALRPGVRASDVDGAARDVLAERGFGRAFTHGTGHGVGFAAIDHSALPRIHPASPDVLEPGMVFNVEPAIYLKDIAGIRHCDVVALGERGATVLTPFHDTIGELVLG
jgi:Xaa-Pro aminopeptidase